MIARQEIHEGGFSRAALSDECDGLSPRHGQTDVVQHGVACGIFKTDVSEFNAVFESVDVDGLGRILDGIGCVEDFVDAFQTRHSFRDAVGRF